MTLTNETKITKTKSATKLFYLIFCLSIIGIQQSYSQDRITLQGKITNATNQTPISDATILIRDVQNGTVSDSEGNYTLGGIKSGDVIEVSKLGFRTVIYTVKGKRKNQKWDVTLSEDLLSLSEVVVTSFGGSSNQKEKIESSVAITTINSKEIDERLPRNNADLLKAIPGFWVESAGGDGPASVWVRGFPQAGGYAFLGIMEDGLPVFQTGYYSLPSPDQFYKIDETLYKVEAIRGGSAPIIMQGAVGAVVNHISKTGSQFFKGNAKLSYNPLQGLGRIDLNIGGPMSKKTTYNVGGFYRNETGLYDYGYAANRGGQIRANIKQKFNKLTIKYYAKFIDDHVNWNLPSPYLYNKNGDVDEIPGFDLKTAGIGTDESDTELSYVLPSGKAVDVDLKDGFYTNLLSGGLELDFTIGKNWSLVNKFRYDDITHNNNSDVITAVSDITPIPIPGLNYTYTDGTIINDPENLNGNGLIATNFILKTDNKYKQLINRMELSNNTNKNNFTLGAEYYNYKLADDASSSITTKEVKNSPRLIVTPTLGTITPFSLLSPAGQNTSNGTEETISVYIDDQFRASEKLSLNVGLRFDSKSVIGNSSVQTGQSILLGGAGYVDTGIQEFEDSRSGLSATLGLNLKINNNSSLFARSTLASNSIKIGDYTSLLVDIDALKNAKNAGVSQTELGFKYRGDKTALFTSVIYATVNDAISPNAIPDATGVGLIFQNIFQSTRTVSAEIEAQYKPNNKWLFKLVNTIQDAEYSKLNFIAREGTIVAGQEFDWSGNKAEHVPAIASDLYASYTIKKLVLSADVRYYGDRWSTPANNIKLKGYAEFNAGINYIFNPRLNLRIQGANLFNSVALIEGNTRGDQFITADALDGSPAIGKRILPRALFFKLIYNFGL